MSSGPDESEVLRARQLAIDLIDTVRQQFEAHIHGTPTPAPTQASPPPVAAPLSISPPPGQPSFGYAPGATPIADPYAAYGGYQAYQQYCMFPFIS